MSEPAAYVHVELAGATRLVGHLFASAGRSTFTYAPAVDRALRSSALSA